MPCIQPRFYLIFFYSTVELRSKGPATKGNRSLRDNGPRSRLSPFNFLLFGAPARWDTALRETSLFGKDFSVPGQFFSPPAFFFVPEEEKEEEKEGDEVNEDEDEE